MFKRGTILLRRMVDDKPKARTVIVDVHEDMLKEKFWSNNSCLLNPKSPQPIVTAGDISDIVKEQLEDIVSHSKKLNI